MDTWPGPRPVSVPPAALAHVGPNPAGFVRLRRVFYENRNTQSAVERRKSSGQYHETCLLSK